VAFHPNRKSSQSASWSSVRSLARKVEEGPRAAERQASVASPVPRSRVKQRPVRACWAPVGIRVLVPTLTTLTFRMQLTVVRHRLPTLVADHPVGTCPVLHHRTNQCDFSEPQLFLPTSSPWPLRRRVGLAPWMRRWVGEQERGASAPRGYSLHRVRGPWVDAELDQRARFFRRVDGHGC
jgi:hypothetical protein